ncbi:hypothetical protein TIFTF001_012686 [Ficus carica]|uniref:Uncharacterized protein n=1 Tax=Ficus carica TaxID=3494 RepID=A0AA88A2U0_FICCA|nr:hypothetical protein TIFTF001_012686 [Ficus carica]
MTRRFWKCDFVFLPYIVPKRPGEEFTQVVVADKLKIKPQPKSQSLNSPMAAADRIQHLPISVLVRLFLLVLLVPTQLYSSHAMSLSGSASSGRNLLGSSSNANTIRRNSNRIPNCNDMSSASLCSQNPKCRWCRSLALDDMCFSKPEASRLPLEVFSCS